MKTPARKVEKRLLLIDDEELLLGVIGRHLRARGWRVYCASSAEEGIMIAAREPLSAIMVDNVLPGMSGLQAVRKFAHLGSAPVVLMTGSLDADTEKDALLCGARAVFGKPLDFTSLEARLEAVIAASPSS